MTCSAVPNKKRNHQECGQTMDAEKHPTDSLPPEYAKFLATKAPAAVAVGIEPSPMPDHLFDFQANVTAFALRQGRAALFLDTGMGKTRCQLEWAKQAAAATNRWALILTPLAVARQIEREGLALGYDCRVIREMEDAAPGINICNYDRLDKLHPERFGAVSLDESSVLKSFTGATTRALIAAFRDHRFKLCATATPAPNDHMELGQHAEFLGLMSSVEMLTRWFINDTATASQHWRIKGHAEQAFWDWMASWARCAETPADLGYDGSKFILPALNVIRHKVAGDVRPAAGSLFVEDMSATNIHAIKRQTAEARADAVADLIAAEPDEAWLIWVDTDYEADAVNKRIKSAVEVRGSHTPERKENMLLGFATGDVQILLTKTGIAGAGMNYQRCARMAFVGRSFSYESWYQAVRRCWRFGQTRPVDVHIAVAEGEEQIGRVITRKAEGHTKMKRAMADAMKRALGQVAVVKVPYNPTYIGRLPSWLKSAA
ncbi:MAG: helicase [Proteobacteria bacterium]|nr:helicase [Pseudomonadota bacterium]